MGRKEPNPWGLHDMLGNVYEMVQDWHGDYPGGTVTDPQGPVSGSFRVSRGGNWGGGANRSSAPHRAVGRPGTRNEYAGFRLLKTE